MSPRLLASLASGSYVVNELAVAEAILSGKRELAGAWESARADVPSALLLETLGVRPREITRARTRAALPGPARRGR
jgi:hypothetical protein